MKAKLKLVILLAPAAVLAGCELREEAPAPEPTPTETLSAQTKQDPTEAEAPSIIRPDVTAALPPRVEPPQPLAATVGFPDGGDDLDQDALGVLRDLAASPQLSEGWPIVLRGHTDSVGNDSANLVASRQRAEAVASWLIDTGVTPERIEVIAMGEQRPIAPNALLDGSPSEAGRARNRRVEVWIGPPGTRPPERSTEEAGTQSEAAPPTIESGA